MSFLAPLFLIGALAITAPIIFHLIRRTPTIQQRFSSLMFLSPSPPQLSRRSRLDKILLLLLRCIIICLLAFAFARPFLRDKFPIQSATGPQKITVLLIDSSASMKRDNLWADAVGRVRELARSAAPHDQMQIALFDRSTRKLLSFEEWSALSVSERVASVERKLAEVGATWYAGEPGSALIFAAEELNALGQLHPSTLRQIVVLSDLQEGSRMQNLQGFDWPKGIDVVFETLRAKKQNNAGLHPAVEGETSGSGPSDTRPLVRVSNSPQSKREQFRLTWIDGKTAGAVGNPIDVQVLPGKARVFRAPERPQSAADVRLVLTGDDEPFDNTLYVAAAEPERVQVAFIGAGAEDDPSDLLYYLKRAFQETRRRTVSITPLRTATDVNIPAEIRFLIAPNDLSTGQAEAIRKHLERGGSALLVLKNPASTRAVEQLVNSTGALASEAAVKEYAMLEQIEFSHPIFAPFAEPRFGDFTKVHFWKHRHLNTDALPNARVLARFDDGAPALLETDVGDGKMMILTSGWQPTDSQLALSSKFVPLLYSMLEYAGCFKEQAGVFTVGSEVPVRSPGMTLQRPDGSQRAQDGGRWILETPGIFTATEGKTIYKLAANLDPAESKTAPLELEELQKLGVPMRTTAARSAATIEKERKWAHATELESRQKLWRWLIAATLLVVLIETWFAARLSRPAVVEA
jgi:hypothetical protein